MKRNAAALFVGVALIGWSAFQLFRLPELNQRLDGSDFDVLFALRHGKSELLRGVFEALGFVPASGCSDGAGASRWTVNALTISPWMGALTALLLAAVVASTVRANRAVSITVCLVGVLMAIPGAAIAHDLAVEVHDSTVFMPEYEMVLTQRCGQHKLAPSVEVTRAETIFQGGSMGTDVPTIEGNFATAILESRKESEDLHRQTGDHQYNWERESSLVIIAEQNAELTIIAAVTRGTRGAGIKRGQIISKREQPGRLWTRPSVHRHACALWVEFADDGVPVTQFASWRALVDAADSSPVPLELRAE